MRQAYDYWQDQPGYMVAESVRPRRIKTNRILQRGPQNVRTLQLENELHLNIFFANPQNDEKLNDEDKVQINEKLDALKKAKENGNVADMKKALEELSNSWSQVATKMYDGANQEGQQQKAPSSDDKKEKNKDEIEDADFEVVD